MEKKNKKIDDRHKIICSQFLQLAQSIDSLEKKVKKLISENEHNAELVLKLTEIGHTFPPVFKITKEMIKEGGASIKHFGQVNFEQSHFGGSLSLDKQQMVEMQNLRKDFQDKSIQTEFLPKNSTEINKNLKHVKNEFDPLSEEFNSMKNEVPYENKLLKDYFKKVDGIKEELKFQKYGWSDELNVEISKERSKLIEIEKKLSDKEEELKIQKSITSRYKDSERRLREDKKLIEEENEDLREKIARLRYDMFEIQRKEKEASEIKKVDQSSQTHRTENLEKQSNPKNSKRDKKGKIKSLRLNHIEETNPLSKEEGEVHSKSNYTQKTDSDDLDSSLSPQKLFCSSFKGGEKETHKSKTDEIVDEYKEEIETLQRRIRDLKKKVIQKGELDKLKEKTASKLIELVQKNKNLSGIIESQEREITKNNRLNQKIKQAIQFVDGPELSKLQNERRIEEKNLEVIKEQLSAYETELKEAKSKQELRERIQQLESRTMELSEIISSKEKEFEAQKKDLSKQLEVEYQEKIEAIKQKHRKKLNSKKDKIKDLNEEIKEIKAELASLKKQRSAAAKKIVAELNNEITRVTDENLELKESLLIMEHEKKELELDLKNKNAQFEDFLENRDLANMAESKDLTFSAFSLRTLDMSESVKSKFFACIFPLFL